MSFSNGIRLSNKTFLWGWLALFCFFSIAIIPVHAEQGFWDNYSNQVMDDFQSRQDFLAHWDRLPYRLQTLFERIENEEAMYYWFNQRCMPSNQSNYNKVMSRIGATPQEGYFVSAWMGYLSDVEPVIQYDNCLSPRKTDMAIYIGSEDDQIQARTGKYLRVINTQNPLQDRNVQYMMRVSNARPEEVYYVCIALDAHRYMYERFSGGF